MLQWMIYEDKYVRSLLKVPSTYTFQKMLLLPKIADFFQICSFLKLLCNEKTRIFIGTSILLLKLDAFTVSLYNRD